MLRWCAKYGITVNQETIWRSLQREKALVEAVKRRMLSEPGSKSWDGSSSWSTLKTEGFEQKSLPFGKLSG